RRSDLIEVLLLPGVGRGAALAGRRRQDRPSPGRSARRVRGGRAGPLVGGGGGRRRFGGSGGGRGAGGGKGSTPGGGHGASTAPRRRAMPATPLPPRRLPIGAEILGDRVHFRVWAPRASAVDVVWCREPDGAETTSPLIPDTGGYFAGAVPGAGAGARYQFRLDGGQGRYPDPASRFQPDGPHGPSEVVDPGGFPWSDGDWLGVELAGQVLYELHVGTFTCEGTWAAAMRELPELARAGITLVEVMPV